ncbi:serine/threonine-protein kinase [Blastococcus deserti]|uniref:Uncharacterized protein n=1 Tax=Blastococcus deserti TaxID=2259033 RepID=A0ABW4X437_9ACTN
MTAFLPEPVPLEMPPGDPAAVDEVESDVGGAAFWFDVLADELSAPAASAPGWLGDDAGAAAGQVVRIAAIVGECATAARTASRRLSAHGDLLRETRRGVAALRVEQEEDRRAAWGRLHALGDLATAMRTGAPEAVSVVEDFAAAEAARRRRHGALLEELADDAAATARVLADAAGPVGGTGRPGDTGRVLAHLAAELPGWGTPEMARRGRALADALVGTPLRPEEREELAAEAAAYAGDAHFATALLRELGETGVALLLALLGQDPDGPDNPIAGLLASALGAAVPREGRRDAVSAVLDATYVRADDRLGAHDTAAGMAAVLVAGAGSHGPRMATVVEWARQLLVREHVQKQPTGMTVAAWGRPGEGGDPVAVAVGTLARGGDPEAAAALLADREVWDALLLRSWGDDGGPLGDLVAEAGRDDGPAGDRAVRLGLESIGAGLAEGDPSGWTVDRDTVAAVSPALGQAAAAHVQVITGALTSVGAGGGGDRTVDQLRGLGYLTVDRGAAAVVETALRDWSLARPLDLAGTSPDTPHAAVSVPSAYHAVQDYGQRLTYALDGFELEEEAEDKEALWNWTAGLALELLSYAPVAPLAVAADVVGAYGPILLDVDGTFDQEADRGLRFDAAGAARDALAMLPPDRAAQAHAVEAQAEAAFGRTAHALGSPAAPRSPEEDWAGATRDLITGGLADKATEEVIGNAERRRPFGGLLPGRR